MRYIRSWPISSGHRNAFQEPMKVMVPTAAAMPYAFGITTRQNVRQ